MSFQLAKDNEAAVRACKPLPLTAPDDPRYVDFSEQYGLCRGGKNRLINSLKPNDVDLARHLVLAGPGGSGKSTLVLQSFAEFRSSGLYPVHVDVLDMLDPGDVQYSDLMLSMVAGIAGAVGKDPQLGVSISESAVDDVGDWFRIRVLSEEHIKELSLDVQAGAKASTGIPFIGNLFAKMTAAFQGGSKYRGEIRKNIDKRPGELVEKVNVFLDALTHAMRDKGDFREVLVFFDNLEKIHKAPFQVDNALINKAPLFQQIRCKALYSIPFSLLLNPGESGLVSNVFELAVIPMVALCEPHANLSVSDPERVRSFGRIIERRMDIDSIFESMAPLDTIIEHSGGCPRDLLSITRLACEYAGEGKVNGDSVQKALNRARVEHLRPIKGSDFSILARVHRDKYIENTEDEFRLLYHRLIVHYNDTEWYDAHPLAQLDPRFIEADEALKKR